MGMHMLVACGLQDEGAAARGRQAERTAARDGLFGLGAESLLCSCTGERSTVSVRVLGRGEWSRGAGAERWKRPKAVAGMARRWLGLFHGDFVSRHIYDRSNHQNSTRRRVSLRDRESSPSARLRQSALPMPHNRTGSAPTQFALDPAQSARPSCSSSHA